MRHMLEKYKAGNVRVIPILLRPTAFWQKTPIGNLQVLPRDGKPITEHADYDAAFVDIINVMLYLERAASVPGFCLVVL
jgi:hypothetical protein